MKPTKVTLEDEAYSSYQDFCRRLGNQALDRDSWRFQSRRLFGSIVTNSQADYYYPVMAPAHKTLSA